MAGIPSLGTVDKPHLGTSGNDTLQGTAGDDHLYGAGGSDVLFGGAGNDILNAGMVYLEGAWRDDRNGDRLDGGAGNDKLWGGAGSDIEFGGDGDDRLEGVDGNDSLDGGAGNDTLFGGAGNDRLDGGGGNDELYGGAGDDYYLLGDRRTVIRDYEGNNSGLVTADFIKPTDGISWSWAAGVQKLPYWIDALTYAPISGIGSALGARHTVHYSFAQQPVSWFTADDRQQFSPFSKVQRDFTVKLLQYVSSLANIEFVETSDMDKAYTIVFGNNEQASSGGYAAPIYSGHGTPLMLDYDPRYADPGMDNGLAFSTTMLHEIGHALQLKHPFGHADAVGNTEEGPFLPKAEDLKSLSIASYTYDPGVYGYTSYSPFDLAALHYGYGVSASARAGNDRYVIDPNAMNMLWDGAGYDTIDASAQSRDVVLDLRPGYWGYVGQKAALISAAGQITVNFGSVFEAALGGSGNDTITGNDAQNTLKGGAGNDTLHGGGGRDTVQFTGLRADFTIQRNGDSVSVIDNTGREGRDTLDGVERLQFGDTMVTLQTDGPYAQVFRLYQAFDRKPELQGLGFWMANSDQGMGLQQIAGYFIDSPEFARLYGTGIDDTTFLTHLYANVLDRKYDQEGLDFWLTAMNKGLSRAGVLTGFSESPENIANVAALIANGIEYAPYG